MVTTLIAFLSTARELLCESFLPVRFLPPEKRDESPTHKHVAHSKSTCLVLSLLDMYLRLSEIKYKTKRIFNKPGTRDPLDVPVINRSRLKKLKIKSKYDNLYHANVFSK